MFQNYNQNSSYNFNHPLNSQNAIHLQPPLFNSNYPASYQKPFSTSQSRPESSSNFPTRLRIHSHQETPKHNDNELHLSRHQNLQKIKFKGSQLKQSNGIMNQPPDYIANKYTFKSEFDTARMSQDSNCMFGSCCSLLKETQKEIYLSPTQLISMGYFHRNQKTEPKSLKIQKNLGSSNSVQKSFFKETSNVIE